MGDAQRVEVDRAQQRQAAPALPAVGRLDQPEQGRQIPKNTRVAAGPEVVLTDHREPHEVVGGVPDPLRLSLLRQLP